MCIRDSHCCEQLEGGRFSYRAVNIPAEVMARFVREITGDGEPPVFCGPVIENEEAAYHLQKLHRMMMEGSGEFEKEEHLLLLLGTLIGLGGRPSAERLAEDGGEIGRACRFMAVSYTHLDVYKRQGRVCIEILLRLAPEQKPAGAGIFNDIRPVPGPVLAGSCVFAE